MAVRPTYAEIDDSALVHNIAAMRGLVSHGRVLAVVKADGYGHGAVRAARSFAGAGAWGLAVALVEEGIALRHAGIHLPIVVLGGVYRGYEDLVVVHNLIPTVWERAHLESLSAAAQRAPGLELRVHLKVDTGMGRLGVPVREVAGLVDAWTHGLGTGLKLHGVLTHLACADEPDDTFSAVQLADFAAACTVIENAGLRPELRHAANSAAAWRYPAARLDLLRPGLALYGVEPSPGLAPQLRPAMALRSRIVAIRQLVQGHGVSYGRTHLLARDSRVAVVPVGYEDGYPWRCSGKAEVLVSGQRVPVLGRITMDTMLVDVTSVGAGVGDEVVLVGEQHGERGGDRVTVVDLAGWADTLAYEVLCGISRRVPRV